MTNDELDEIWKRHVAAESDIQAWRFASPDGNTANRTALPLIADIAALLAEVRRLQAENERLQKLNKLYSRAIPDDD